MALTQDWNDLDSFAGLVPGEHWVFGVPYRQGDRAASHPLSLDSPLPRTLFAAYAPEGDAAPKLILSDGSRRPLAGKAVLAWRAWPPLFEQRILLDYADIPAGAPVTGMDPNGALLMAVTLGNDPTASAAARKAMAAAAIDLAGERRERETLAQLRRRVGALPDGALALLPGPADGPAANFANLAGLRKKWVRLSPADFVSAEKFNAARFPFAFYLGGEEYLKTVRAEGDGIAALKRYLTEGGTLVLLASGPYPLYYGLRAGESSGQPDPVLPQLGLALSAAFEEAPAGLRIRTNPGQKLLHSVPGQFAFPEGDPRLRPRGDPRSTPPTVLCRCSRLRMRADTIAGRPPSTSNSAPDRAKAARGLHLVRLYSTSPEGNAILGDAMSSDGGKSGALVQIHDGRIAVERKGAGAGDLDVQQLAAMARAALEHHDFVATGPARQAGGVFRLGPSTRICTVWPTHAP